MPNTNIISNDEIHAFGINIVLDDVRQNGFAVVSVETNIEKNPQIIASKDEQLFHILVRTARYPQKGKLESRELGIKVIRDAQKQGAFCYFASVGIANALGTTDLEMSIPTKGAGYYIAYDGLEVLTINKVISETATTDIVTINQSGEVAGSVKRMPNGRHTIIAGEKPDISSLLMSMCFIFAEDLNIDQRLIFARWVHLPAGIWSQSHREAFSHALLHFFMEVKTQGGNLPPSLLNALKTFPPQALAPLQYPLTNEIRELFSSLF
jgi:hypothetical protein